MAIFCLQNTGISQFSIPEFGIEFNTGIPEFGIGIGCPNVCIHKYCFFQLFLFFCQIIHFCAGCIHVRKEDALLFKVDSFSWPL